MYKIEIWRYHSICETFENEDVKEVLEWFKDNWMEEHENGGCTFYTYKDNEALDYDTEYDLGFHD
jgi:hypothetical protein